MSADPMLLAHSYIESLAANLGNIRELGPLNEGKELNPTHLQNFLAGKFASQALSPSAAFFMAGAYEKHNRMPVVFKTFLGLAADKWGFSLAESLKFLSVLLVFGEAKKEELALTGLSRSLLPFIGGESSRAIKPIASASLFFIDTFGRFLATQILEVNRKYRISPPDLQEKLVKLYSAPERRGMIVGNAARRALDRIASHASEPLEVTQLLNTFTKKMPDLIALEDLFAADYGRLPVG